jgi:hypothetical protein
MIKMPELSFNGPGMAPFSRDIDNFWYKISRITLTEPSPEMYLRRIRWSNEIVEILNSIGANFLDFNAKVFLKICNSIKIDETNGLIYLRQFFKEICERIMMYL